MYSNIEPYLCSEAKRNRKSGPFQTRTPFEGPQQAEVNVAARRYGAESCARTTIWAWRIIRQVVEAAHEALDDWGYGLASVRFICGTQSIHKQLEARLSEFLGTEDTILYSSCFDANGGLFETLLEAGRRCHLRRTQSRQHY